MAGRAAYEADAGGNRTIPATKRRKRFDAPSSITAAVPTSAQALTQLQLLIVDELADLVLFGGKSEDEDNMLRAAAGHMRRRAAYGDRDVSDHVEMFRSYWKTELAAERTHARAALPELPKPSTVTERARTAALEQLRKHLLEFLGEGTPEEISFLSEVMLNHQGICQGRDNFRLLRIAESFDITIHNGHTLNWVAVPPHLKEQTEAYIECLRAADVTAAGR
jgi:hypothetical protein